MSSTWSTPSSTNETAPTWMPSIACGVRFSAARATEDNKLETAYPDAAIVAPVWMNLRRAIRVGGWIAFIIARVGFHERRTPAGVERFFDETDKHRRAVRP